MVVENGDVTPSPRSPSSHHHLQGGHDGLGSEWADFFEPSSCESRLVSGEPPKTSLLGGGRQVKNNNGGWAQLALVFSEDGLIRGSMPARG